MDKKPEGVTCLLTKYDKIAKEWNLIGYDRLTVVCAMRNKCYVSHLDCYRCCYCRKLISLEKELENHIMEVHF